MQEKRIDDDYLAEQFQRPDREDASAQARVLSLILSEHSRSLSRDEIKRELIGEHAEFAAEDELARAIRDLALAGLLHEVEHMVFPSRAALTFHDLELE
jgi:hypothetical protein